MLIFIIILIIFILFLYYSTNNKEGFISTNYNYKKLIIPNTDFKDIDKFVPINMIINDIKPNGIDNNFKLTPDIIKKAIKLIEITKNNDIYNELEPFKYKFGEKIVNTEINKCFLNSLLDILYKEIKFHIEKFLVTNSKKMCNKFNKCIIDHKDSRILKIGKNGKDNLIEGQLLLELRDSSFEFLIRFVINNKNGFNINYLNLEGFDFIKDSNVKASLTDVGGLFNKEYVNIYKTPLINKYKTNTTYYYGSDEQKIINKKELNKDYLKNKEYRIPKIDIETKENFVNFKILSCYGKSANNKNDCESIYDKDGNQKKRAGVWDSRCVKNCDCPFYKKNKNYPNNYGGCINGFCQMPVGVVQISPTKFLKNKKPVCYNCIKGSFCCEEQKNKKIYPNLKSPDYYFKNDRSLRDKFNLKSY